MKVEKTSYYPEEAIFIYPNVTLMCDDGKLNITFVFSPLDPSGKTIQEIMSNGVSYVNYTDRSFDEYGVLHVNKTVVANSTPLYLHNPFYETINLILMIYDLPLSELPEDPDYYEYIPIHLKKFTPQIVDIQEPYLVEYGDELHLNNIINAQENESVLYYGNISSTLYNVSSEKSILNISSYANQRLDITLFNSSLSALGEYRLNISISNTSLYNNASQSILIRVVIKPLTFLLDNDSYSVVDRNREQFRIIGRFKDKYNKTIKPSSIEWQIESLIQINRIDYRKNYFIMYFNTPHKLGNYSIGFSAISENYTIAPYSIGIGIIENIFIRWINKTQFNITNNGQRITLIGRFYNILDKSVSFEYIKYHVFTSLEIVNFTFLGKEFIIELIIPKTPGIYNLSINFSKSFYCFIIEQISIKVYKPKFNWVPLERTTYLLLGIGTPYISYLILIKYKIGKKIHLKRIMIKI